jgi:SHS2 domain-containing protein
MSYRWVDHTAELELEVEAATEALVFREAAAALSELLDDGAGGQDVVIDLELDGDDRALLLADWLDELVYRAETDGVVLETVEGLALGDRGLRATIRGHRGGRQRLVKGITHHRLSFEPRGRGFRAVVVIDV